MTNRQKQIDYSIEHVLIQMYEWHAANSKEKVQQLCIDKKAYKGKTLYWLEPLVPGLANPCLIEEYLGDHYTLRTEPIYKKIQK